MRCTAIVLVWVLGGCSFVFVSGPPANHRELPAFECTQSNLGPILDGIWTGLQLTNLVGASLVTDQQWNNAYPNHMAPFSRGAAIPMYAAFAALGAAGLYFGITRTRECRAAKREWTERANIGPGTGTGAWPPPAPAPAPPPPAPMAPAPPPPAPPAAPAPAP